MGACRSSGAPHFCDNLAAFDAIAGLLWTLAVTGEMFMFEYQRWVIDQVLEFPKVPAKLIGPSIRSTKCWSKLRVLGCAPKGLPLVKSCSWSCRRCDEYLHFAYPRVLSFLSNNPCCIAALSENSLLANFLDVILGLYIRAFNYSFFSMKR